MIVCCEDVGFFTWTKLEGCSNQSFQGDFHFGMLNSWVLFSCRANAWCDYFGVFSEFLWIFRFADRNSRNVVNWKKTFFEIDRFEFNFSRNLNCFHWIRYSIAVYMKTFSGDFEIQFIPTSVRGAFKKKQPKLNCVQL